MIFSSHVMELVERLCDHVAVIALGRVLANGPIDLVRERARARGGLRRPGRCRPEQRGGPVMAWHFVRLRLRVFVNSLTRGSSAQRALRAGRARARPGPRSRRCGAVHRRPRQHPCRCGRAGVRRTVRARLARAAAAAVQLGQHRRPVAVLPAAAAPRASWSGASCSPAWSAASACSRCSRSARPGTPISSSATTAVTGRARRAAHARALHGGQPGADHDDRGRAAQPARPRRGAAGRGAARRRRSTRSRSRSSPSSPRPGSRVCIPSLASSRGRRSGGRSPPSSTGPMVRGGSRRFDSAAPPC